MKRQLWLTFSPHLLSLRYTNLSSVRPRTHDTSNLTNILPRNAICDPILHRLAEGKQCTSQIYTQQKPAWDVLALDSRDSFLSNSRPFPLRYFFPLDVSSFNPETEGSCLSLRDRKKRERENGGSSPRVRGPPDSGYRRRMLSNPSCAALLSSSFTPSHPQEVSDRQSSLEQPRPLPIWRGNTNQQISSVLFNPCFCGLWV